MQQSALRVGIDASNISRGGGITHLTQLLAAAEPARAGVAEILVWAPSDVLARLEPRPWLRKVPLAVLDGPLRRRLAWQQVDLRKELRKEECDVLFAPGGLVPVRAGVPTVTMSRNMLPFEPIEAARFGLFTPLWLKMKLLRLGQGYSLRQADGVIFLTQYARTQVSRALRAGIRDARTIPHGLEERFFCPPRPAVAREALDGARPFRLLYVSTVDMYKHQWQVVRAAGQLRREGVPVQLDLIGEAGPKAMAKLNEAIAEFADAEEFVAHHGGVPFERLHEFYREADAFVFASSCENLPNILLEAMAAGLPIACSRMGPMPEVLADAGVYFDPLDSRSIAASLRPLIESAPLRDRLASEAFALARRYSWEKCAADTFAFVAEVARTVRHPRPSRS